MNIPVQNISLNGKWKYIPDGQEELSYEKVLSLIPKNKLEEMSIPSNWQLEGLDNFNGSVWFIKEFSFISKISGDLKILKFNGVDYFSDVWVNGKYLGQHEGYFQPFYFNISGLIKQNNILIVKVTSPFEEPGNVWPLKKKLIKGIFNHHDCRPGGWDMQKGQDKNTGGIWNDVELSSGHPVFISQIKISSKINYELNRATLLFELKYLTNSEPAIITKIDFDITTPSGNKIQFNRKINFHRNEHNVIISMVIDDPELWWSWDLGEQNLYKFKITSDVFDEQNIVYGIREVQLDKNQQFFINRKRLFLRGTNIIPEQFLSSFSKERITRLAKLIKDANINIVRVHAHVNRKELYEEFDREGILVWQDFALQWTYDDSTEFISNAVPQIREMVNLLNNYSSICFWCCHNEPGEQIHTLDNFLYRAVLSEDSTRIIRIASNYEEHPYDGWYWGNKEHYAAAPMGPLVTEFGAQALPGLNALKKIFSDEYLFPPNWNKWQYHDFQPDQTFNIAKVKAGNSIEEFVSNSQNYQAELLKTAVEFYRRKKFKGITGIFQFMLIDCWPSVTWSVVDYYENPKPGYEMLKHVYQPIFISINVRQNQYYPGKKILIDIFIINDLHKEFPDCSLHFYLDEKEFYSADNITINSDDVFYINYEKLDTNLQEDITAGNHDVVISLNRGNEKVTESSFVITVVSSLI